MAAQFVRKSGRGRRSDIFRSDHQRIPTVADQGEVVVDKTDVFAVADVAVDIAVDGAPHRGRGHIHSHCCHPGKVGVSNPDDDDAFDSPTESQKRWPSWLTQLLTVFDIASLEEFTLIEWERKQSSTSCIPMSTRPTKTIDPRVKVVNPGLMDLDG